MKRHPGSPAIRVAVAASFPEIVRIHESTAEYADEIEVCAMISNADAVLEQTRLLQPDVLLLSTELGPAHHDTLSKLGALAPATRLVMLVSRAPGDTAVVADGAVPLEAPPSELRAAIVTAMGRGTGEHAPPAHSRVRSAQAPSAAAPGSPGWLRIAPATDPAQGAPQGAIATTLGASGSAPHASAPAEAPPAADVVGRRQRRPSRTVVVFGGKGGVGKSIVATNVATALAVGGASVALVDLDLQYGDVGLLMRLEAHPMTIDVVAQSGQDIDEAALEKALATSAEGVHVLLAPTSPEASDLVSATSLETILALLSRTHNYVVVDAPAHLEERIVGVLEAADQILLVSSFTITSVKDTKLTLRLLQALGVDRDRVALIANQTHPRISFPADEIERALRFPILSSLPFEPRMEESLGSGRPLVVSEPRSGFSRQLALVVDHIGRTAVPRSATKVAPAKWRLRFGR